MGKSNPLYKDPNSKVYFARWYEGKKRIMLTLSTEDPLEAMRRVPIVTATKMSWLQYQKTISGYKENSPSEIKSLSGISLSPPLIMNATRDGTIKLIEKGIKEGRAQFDQQTGQWTIYADSPAKFTDAIDHFRRELSTVDNSKEIEEFYLVSMPQLYLDKVTAERYARIWLDFLKIQNVSSWSRVNEALCVEFKKWRKETKQSRGEREGVAPSNLVVERHFKFLSRSFEEAGDKGFMRVNPIKNWRPETHTPELQQSLTKNELFKVLSDRRWQQDFLMNGKTKVELGYKLQDVLLLLFASCKRRGEILKLKIENINFKNHFSYYTETKNSSKGTSYIIHKAFWLTPELEKLIRQLMAGRKEGYLFPCPPVMKRADSKTEDILNGEFLSEVFREVVGRIVPTKEVSLKNLRQTATDFMEQEGLTDDEIDAALGHHQVKTALKHYQDRSAEAIAKRLSLRTKKGIEILSNTCNQFFV